MAIALRVTFSRGFLLCTGGGDLNVMSVGCLSVECVVEWRGKIAISDGQISSGAFRVPCWR